MSIYSLLNPESEKPGTGELTDEELVSMVDHTRSKGAVAGVRREPISKSCEITQADNLNRRRRLSRKAQCFKSRGW